MAEMAVSLAVDQLLPLLREEANLLKGIHKEFADIKDELESIQAFLKDADRRAVAEGENTDEGVKTWVKQVREAAFRIEDIIEEYLIYTGKKPHDPGCVVSLNKIAHLIKTLIPRHRIASEIRDIKSHVRGIRERSETYSFERGSSSSGGSQNVQWHDPRMASLFVEDAELVGFEEQRDKLIGLLVEGPKERTVISVVGMGGQGKTTLANRVFNNQKVIRHFHFHAWITVSHSYRVEGLLRDMLQKFGKEKKETLEMDHKTLIEEVRNCLQQKRYVVVFDDVWNPHFWDVIQLAVVDNKEGSRILITTRREDVAMSCKKSSSVHVHVHKLEPLSDEKSLELFNKKTFPDFNGRCPDDLVEISCEIVKKCKGLPLAIVCIGGLLCSKGITTALEWKRFSNNLSSELGKNSSISKILGFSYDDLPDYLKPCLLYFGMYPEDYAVKPKRLIRQWIAEGFVKYEKGKTLEEVGQHYLTELVGRSLVQVRSFTIDGKVGACQAHDLTREMILEKCKYLRFCEYIGEDSELVSSGGITRRRSIKTTSDASMENTEGSHVRTLFFFLHDIMPTFSTCVEKLPKKYKLLKVLHFENAYNLLSFPKSLGDLIHLRYLSLEYLTIGNLPKSIGNLQNLETLNIIGTYIRIMPKEIYKLRKLRYLSGTQLKLIQTKDGIGGMTSLQTLKKVRITDDDGVELIRELEKLTQLRSLGLTGIVPKHERALCSSLKQMQQLEKLFIDCHSFDDVIDLSLVSSPPKFVSKLSIELKLTKLPEWVQELQNLAKLTLRCCKLTEDPLKSLQNLPNLMYLNIDYEAYVGESLHFQGGFQNLKELILGRLTDLNSIVMEKGAMSSLERLTFYGLPLLKTVPLGIHNLEKLQVFQVRGNMSVQFSDSIAPDGGQDRWIIQHVPYVSIDALR
ncbi:disease resistance protein RPM1-like [Abrus precatorius]|uniref:Disease resistance protein RPM1-like n=1 Tax=Abrus precatorius TaxID=3816 RepID=A0A8B8KIV7_ABRPR|nr:disease resistance protein RPM1-like [Abrus precatorius]